MLNWVVSTFLTSYLVDYFHNINLGGASHNTTTAPDTARPSIFGDESPLFMVISKFYPVRSALAKILPSRHQGVLPP